MATIGTLSNYLENKLIDHLLRNTAYTPPASVWVALYTIVPTDTRNGTEVNKDGYARQQITFTISGNSAVNTSTLSFPAAGEDWGTIVGVSIMDTVTSGNILLWGIIDNPLVVNEGEIYSINAGGLSVELKGGTKGGWGDGMPENILKHILANTVYATPGNSVYIASGSALSYDEDYTFINWRETSGAGYSRKQAGGTGAWNAPSNGATYNLAAVVFASPPIAADWGRITHIVIFDASTNGNALLWGKLYSPIWLVVGDGFKFAAGDITVRLD